MIEIVVKGNAKEILKFQEKLKKIYNGVYPSVVTEKIPEAVVHNSGLCSASFLLREQWIEIKDLIEGQNSDITIIFPKHIFHKPKKSTHGTWRFKGC